MKFKELKIGDVFDLLTPGWSGEYVREDQNQDNCYELGTKSYFKFSEESKVRLLVRPSVLVNYLKENLCVSIDKYRDYGESGIEVELSLCGEVLSRDRVSLESWCD